MTEPFDLVMSGVKMDWGRLPTALIFLFGLESLGCWSRVVDDLDAWSV